MTAEPSGTRPFWYLEGGDAVRAIACIGIVCFHVATGALFVTGKLAGAGGTLTWMTAYGEGGRIALRTASTGFYLFFALSGFLVAAPFVSAFVEGRPRPRLVPYFRNRALRLVPAAWLLFVFVLIRYGTRGADWHELLWMFTFTDDHVDHPLSTLVGQTWTLRVDLTFYVLVPIAATLAIRLLGPRLGATGRRRAVWVGAATVAAAALVVAGMLEPSVASGRTPAVLICLFMPGVALAAALAGRSPRTPPRRLPTAAAAISLVGVLVLVAYPRDPLPLSARLLVVGLGAGMALGGLVLLETQVGRAWGWMRSGPVRWVGRHTYGIYLWHLVMMAELSTLFQGATSPARTYVLLLPLVLASTLVVAMISFRLVEKPAMRLRHRSTPPAGAPEHAPPAAPVPAASNRTTREPERGRLATGNPLRGLAVLGVVTLHVATGALFVTGYLDGAGGTLRPEEAFTPVGEWILRALPVSVYLFFALSGFLITRPFVEAFVQGRPRPALAPYLRNRALRLFPAAWVLLLFVYLRYGTRDATLGELVSAFTLTESYAPHPLETLTGQMWSLKVELGFYLLVPLAFLAIWKLMARGSARVRRRAIYALALVGSMVSLVFSATATDSVVAARSLVWVLIAFMAGLALAGALAGRRPVWEGRRARGFAALAFVGGVVIALLAGHMGVSSPWLTNLLATLSVCGLLWAPVMLETGGGGTWRWLDNRVLSWIGARSYAIYLWHVVVMSEVYPLVRGIEGYRVAMLALLPLVLAGSALVAELSWRLVESPALRLRAGRRRRQARAPLQAEGMPAAAAAGGPVG